MGSSQLPNLIERLGLQVEVKRLYSKYNNYAKVARELNIDPSHVERYMTHRIELAEEKIETDLQVTNEIVNDQVLFYKKIYEKMNEWDVAIQQFKEQVIDEQGKVKIQIKRGYEREFLVALKDQTSVVQWIIDRKIKIYEMMENSIFRNAIIEELKKESPEFVDRVIKTIERLKDKYGCI